MKCIYFNKRYPMYTLTNCPKGNYSCFTTWEIDQNEFKLKNKGCWPNCESNLAKNVLFCCCDGNLCNQDKNLQNCFDQEKQKLVWNKMIKIFNNLYNSLIPEITFEYILVIGLIIFLTLIIVIIVIYRSIDRKIKLKFLNQCKSVFKFRKINKYDLKKLSKKDSDYIEKDIIKLANGSQSDIYKGRLIKKNRKTIEIAIKIFKSNSELFFKNEYLIYSLPKFEHLNILKFIKAKKTIDNELWLITKYQENGSLLNYLKNNTINLNQLIQISFNLSNGLNYLHNLNDNNKRIIVHYDLKPSNILLDSKLNASISDFEISKVFYNSKLLLNDNTENIENDNYENCNQINKRYSSPEILSRLIDPKQVNSLDIETLMKSDIYSCSLVYWEMLNRLEFNYFDKLNNQFNMNNNKEYRMVYDDCLNNDQFINYVVNQRKRPEIYLKWKGNNLLNTFCEIMEKCWEHDSKSRLNASILNERLKKIYDGLKNMNFEIVINK